MALPKYESEIILTSATQLGTMNDGGGADTITIPAGSYYLTSVHPDAPNARSFCAEVAAQMESSMGAGSSSVTVADSTDTATGYVTISRSSGFSITFTSTALRNTLGFSGNSSTATSHTGDKQPPVMWLPNCGRSGIMAPQGSTGAIAADYTVAIAPPGTAYPISYSTRGRDSMEHRTVTGNKAWDNLEVVTNESFETFYRASIAVGRRIRFHKDRTDDSTHRTWVVEDGGHYDPTPVREDWADGAASLWAFRYSVCEISD